MLKIRTYKFNYLGLLCFFTFIICSCVPTKKIVLNYWDSYKIEPNLIFQESTVGGVSGIDYRTDNGTYYLVSDDRSEINPARFYVTDINISDRGIDSIIFLKTVLFKGDDNRFIEEQFSDFESIRFNPILNVLYVADEGGQKGNSRIRIMDTIGNPLRDVKIDSIYLNKIRPNKSFESISFSSDFKSFFYATEAPLLDDGDEASISKGGRVRIIESDLDGVVRKEFIYQLEKVPYPAVKSPPWGGVGSDNGLSEILSFGKDQFLTLERSGAYQEDGTFKFSCKVFLVKPKTKNNGIDLKTIETTKEEVIDFSKLSNGLFNVEGMTLGPIINKKQSILFVTDNNFEDTIATMIYLFRINEK